MRKKFGIICIACGVLFLLISIGLAVYNCREAERGEMMAHSLLQDVQVYINSHEHTEDPQTSDDPDESLAFREMMTVPVGNYESIGILSIPVLELELPVLTDWSYQKLKMAPCHYYGSCYEPNFVIAAHNYSSHFGRLSQLYPGDLVIFTDVTGAAQFFEVVLLETLSPAATEEMITSGFDLSLYTCTPGGGSRITVRCKTIDT